MGLPHLWLLSTLRLKLRLRPRPTPLFFMLTIMVMVDMATMAMAMVWELELTAMVDTTVLVANLPHVLTLSMFPFPVLLAVNAVMLRLLPRPKQILLTSMVDTTDILVFTDMEVTTADMLDTMDMELAKLPLVSMPGTFLSPVPKMFVQKIQKCPKNSVLA